MGLIKRNGVYYAEFFNSQQSPRSKRYSLRTRYKRPATSQFHEMQLAKDRGTWDPWEGPYQATTDDKQEKHDDAHFKDLVQAFLASRQRLGRSPETLRTYSEVLRGLKARLPDVVKGSEVFVRAIQRYVYDDSVSPATRSKRYGHIRTFTGWASARGLIESDPIVQVEKPKQRQVIPKSITIDQLDLICEAMRADYQSKLQSSQVSMGQIIWRIPLFKFALFTGMRASELARMKWCDVDLELRLAAIREQKNGHQQTVPLCKSAVDILRLLDNRLPTEFVFVSPTGNRTSRSSKRFAERSSKVFRHYRREVGLPEQICFHSLRHGFCTALANAGKSSFTIKAAARHKDISTSLRYIHVSQRVLLDQVDDVFG